jgi:hypothetical protein
MKIGDVVALSKQGSLYFKTSAGETAGAALLPGYKRVVILADRAYAILRVQGGELCIEVAEYGSETIHDENRVCAPAGDLEIIKDITIAADGSINQDLVEEVRRALTRKN